MAGRLARTVAAPEADGPRHADRQQLVLPLGLPEAGQVRHGAHRAFFCNPIILCSCRLLQAAQVLDVGDRGALHPCLRQPVLA